MNKKLLISLVAFLATLGIMAQDVLQVVPFETRAGVVYDDEEVFEVDLINTKKYQALQFDLYVPEWIEVDCEGVDANPSRLPGPKRNYSPYHTISITDKGSGHYLITMVDINPDRTSYINGEEGALFYMYYTTADVVAPGYYPIIVSGTVLAEDSHHDFKPQTSVSYVKVGNPDNAIFELGSDLLIPSFVQTELDNLDNIIVNGICNNLVITDGTALNISAPFTATNVTYTRSMANQWGTIVLPYDVASSDDVAYYVPSGVEDGVLKLTQMDVLPANTPALVEKRSGEGVTATAQNVTVVSDIQDGVNGNVTMHGSYVNDTKVTDANAYYIKNNKFWLNNEYFFVDAFRAYFTVDGAANAKVLSIGETTAIDALIDGGSSISGYYDASGRAQDALKKGVNIVRLSNGKTQKIIVE